VVELYHSSRTQAETLLVPRPHGRLPLFAAGAFVWKTGARRGGRWRTGAVLARAPAPFVATPAGACRFLGLTFGRPTTAGFVSPAYPARMCGLGGQWGKFSPPAVINGADVGEYASS
jgi:hypothetical protein